MWNKLWFQGSCLYAVTDSSLPVYRTCSLPWRTGSSSSSPSTPAPPPPPSFSLTLTSAGTGAGSVAGAGNYTAGTTVTLSATAAAGSVFAGWSGNALCPATSTGTLSMPAAAVSCTATFTLTAPSSFPLTLTTAGAGSGTVTGAGTYAPGATVTLSATPTAGSTFAGWTGSAVCPSGSATSFTMPAAATTCTATFNAPSGGGTPPSNSVTWTPILKPVRGAGAVNPAPNECADQTNLGCSSGHKHSRFECCLPDGTSVLIGGDHLGDGPGGVPGQYRAGSGDGQNTVWATTDLTSWTLLAWACPTGGALYPARSDNVIWALDNANNRALVMPGYYFGVATALQGCPSNSNTSTNPMFFDFTTHLWSFTPYSLPPTPGGGYWGGDNASTFGTHDPTSGNMVRYVWDGAWGANLQLLNFNTGAWENRPLGCLGASPGVATVCPNGVDAELRNSFAVRSQLALDVAGRAVYFTTPSNHLFRVRLDAAVGSPGHDGEWIGYWPSQCVVQDGNQENYQVFDSDHRAVVYFCVPNLGGEVVGIGVYYVDSGTWAYFAAPLGATPANAVVANIFTYSTTCHCILALGGHQIFTENPARLNPAPNPCVPPAGSDVCAIPPGNQQIGKFYDWQIKLTP
jgi:hypothetical protein